MSYNSQYNNPNNLPFVREFQSKFLTFSDFGLIIQAEDLGQILNDKCLSKDWKGEFTWSALTRNSQQYILQAESLAIAEMESYLKIRFIMNEAFPQTQYYIGSQSSGMTFFGKNQILYSEPNYNSGVTYNQADRFSFCGNIYSTLYSGGTSGTSPYTAFNPSYTGITGTSLFSFVTQNESLWFAQLPCEEWNQKKNYNQNDIVWYEDNIYQASKNVNGLSPASSKNLLLRYGIPAVQSYLGIYPENGGVVYGLIEDARPKVNPSWQLYTSVNLGPMNFTGQTYYFTGQTPTSASAYWVQGDIRNPQLKTYLLDVMLFHLCSRVNPRNIPKLRQDRYKKSSSEMPDGAIDWLIKIEQGKIALDVPKIVPDRGSSVIWGSLPKLDTWY